MDNRDIARGLLFKELEIENIDSFDSRILLQKKVYLLKVKGIDLGYNYNWYIYGPYSPTLSDYAYENIDFLVNYNYEEKKLSKEAKNIVKSINDLDKYRTENLDYAAWYELLASITYIYDNINFWGTSKDKESIEKILISEKPKYGKEDFEAAWEALCFNGFLTGDN